MTHSETETYAFHLFVEALRELPGGEVRPVDDDPPDFASYPSSGQPLGFELTQYHQPGGQDRRGFEAIWKKCLKKLKDRMPDDTKGVDLCLNVAGDILPPLEPKQVSQFEGELRAALAYAVREGETHIKGNALADMGLEFLADHAAALYVHPISASVEWRISDAGVVSLDLGELRRIIKHKSDRCRRRAAEYRELWLVIFATEWSTAESSGHVPVSDELRDGLRSTGDASPFARIYLLRPPRSLEFLYERAMA